MTKVINNNNNNKYMYFHRMSIKLAEILLSRCSHSALPDKHFLVNQGEL